MAGRDLGFAWSCLAFFWGGGMHGLEDVYIAYNLSHIDRNDISDLLPLPRPPAHSLACLYLFSDATLTNIKTLNDFKNQFPLRHGTDRSSYPHGSGTSTFPSLVPLNIAELITTPLSPITAPNTPRQSAQSN